MNNGIYIVVVHQTAIVGKIAKFFVLQYLLFALFFVVAKILDIKHAIDKAGWIDG